MPSIDLARLRKQASRLMDFFFAPDEFIKQLHAMLNSYVNYTVRRRQVIPPGMDLQTYRTPVVVIRQIEQELSRLADANEKADATLDLADHLWDQEWLETRRLAGFLLGRLPPRGERLLARLTAWAAQSRDPELRSELLNTSLARMRRETPGMFLDLVREWLQPERTRFWPDGIRAVISAVSDPDFINLPPLLEVIEPIATAAPAQLQVELEELILALYRVSPIETTYFVRDVLLKSDNPMTATTFRRILHSFPAELKADVRELVRGKSLSNH
jgi:hypothetical protein